MATKLRSAFPLSAANQKVLSTLIVDDEQLAREELNFLLKSHPEVEAQGTFLSLEHDPELLRRKISGFIEAIDRYLENERKRS